MGAKHSQEAIQQFMLAVARNDKKYVSGRINAGFKINTRDMVGQTASHWAAYRGNLEILELLASKNARLDIVDFDGRTPLHWAIRKLRLRCLKFLLQATENQPSLVDRQTKGMNETCLHKAAREGSVDGVKLLLSHGANIDVLNNENLSAYQIAEELYKVEIADAAAEMLEDDKKDTVEQEAGEQTEENGKEEEHQVNTSDLPKRRSSLLTIHTDSNYKKIMDLLKARPSQGDPSLKTEFDEGALSSKKALKRRMSYKQAGGQMSEINEERLRAGLGDRKKGCVIC